MRYQCCRKKLVAGAVALSLVACGRLEVPEASDEYNEVVVAEESAEEEEEIDKNLLGDEEPEDTSESAGIDLDLTGMSTTMVYSEVYNIMVNPKDYIGKTIKMKGECLITPSDDNTKVYYACLIKDATACCSQGIEFELSEDYEYPQEGEQVTVSGIFDTYEEDGVMYCHLKNAKRYE